MINELNIYPLSGLLVEFKRKSSFELSTEKFLVLNGKRSLKNANRLFWAEHLEASKLNGLIELARDKYRYSLCNIPQYRVVLDNPDLFLEQIIKSVQVLPNPVLSEQNFFSAMENLTIMCNLYSDLIYKPYRLTIDQGFLLNETDSRTLIEGCLNPVTNPYFNFLNRHCKHVIEAAKPDLIWIFGQPSYSSIAMSMLARKAFPDVHICLVDFPSEYYSLNKIKHLLKKNWMLFSVIDTILLNRDVEFRVQLAQAIEHEKSFNKVPNLICPDREKDEIITTHSRINFQNVDVMPCYFDSSDKGEPVKTVNDNNIAIPLKMWPEVICYWNRCSFCGINQKYHKGLMSDQYDKIERKVNFIEKLTDKGYQFFWMVDEAVPPSILEKFANRLIKREIAVNWQARSRIDKGFTKQVCSSLAKAGLKEIRFGLESASYRILKLMDKFEDGFHLSLVEKIVERFHKEKVSVHFCLILDFPGETHEDRMETFNFLNYLKSRYPSITFNLNRFMLDISSKMCAKYESYNITKIEWPCPSKYFLGNLLGWDTENRKYHRDQIDALRNSFMREKLYPWMPLKPMTPPFNFYMQYEAFMMTLIWKTKKYFQKPDIKTAVFSEETKIKKSDGIVYSKVGKRGVYSKIFYRVYIWDTHIHFECDEMITQLYDFFIRAHTVQEGLTQFYKQNSFPTMSKEQVFEKYYPELEKAFNLNIVSRVDDNNAAIEDILD